MKKLIALGLAVMMVLSVSLALARTVETDYEDLERLAGSVVHATVGAYDEKTGTFTVTLYQDDIYDEEEIEKIAAGDTLLAGDQVHRVKERTTNPSGDLMIVTEDGFEIVFLREGDDDMIAESTDDNRRYMHAFAVLQLPVVQDLVYEDFSDPLADAPIVTTGLEDILKIKAEKEETSIGFDFYATVIELNENLEIVRIHQDFDVAQ